MTATSNSETETPAAVLPPPPPDFLALGRYEGVWKSAVDDCSFEIVIDENNLQPYQPSKYKYAFDGFFEWRIISGSQYSSIIGFQAMERIRGFFFNNQEIADIDKYLFMCVGYKLVEPESDNVIGHDCYRIILDPKKVVIGAKCLGHRLAWDNPLTMYRSASKRELLDILHTHPCFTMQVKINLLICDFVLFYKPPTRERYNVRSFNSKLKCVDKRLWPLLRNVDYAHFSDDDTNYIESESKTNVSTNITFVDEGKKEFIYCGKDFDENGILYYIGTDFGRSEMYVNPSESGMIEIIAYPKLKHDSSSVHCILDRQSIQKPIMKCEPNHGKRYLRIERVFMDDFDRAFLVLDYSKLNILINVSHFTIKNDNPYWMKRGLNSFNFDGRRKRCCNWKLLYTPGLTMTGTGRQWSDYIGLLCDEHLKSVTFCIKDEKRTDSEFNQFRIIINLVNIFDDNHIYIMGFEMYGNVRYLIKDELNVDMTFIPPLIHKVEDRAENAMDWYFSADYSRFLFTDYGGVLHWLSHNYDREWKCVNAVDRGLCDITYSSLAIASKPNSIVSGLEVDRCITENEENSWIMIDLSKSGVNVNVSHYALRHYSTWNEYALRKWRFEAYDDASQEWMLLMMSNDDECHLNRKGSAHLWKIDYTANAKLMDSYFNKFRIMQIGVNSGGDNRLALGAFEIYGRVRLKDHQDIINTEEGIINEEYEMKDKTNASIHRLGHNLQMYSQMNVDVSQINLKEVTDDYTFLQQLCNENEIDFESIFNEINIKYFNGKGCALSKCESMFRNSRDRMKESKEKNDNNRKYLRMLDSIHCSIMHSFDTGMRLTKDETLQIANANNNNNMNVSETEDTEIAQIKTLVQPRTTSYMNMRRDITHEDTNEDTNEDIKNIDASVSVVTKSKFMSVVDEEKQPKADGKNSYDISYSFGKNFDYSTLPAKYENMKEEVMCNPFCSLLMDEFNDTYFAALTWMRSKYILKMKDEYQALFNIQHVLAILFYCNFTQLCTVFSSTYRRCPSNESELAMMERHSHFREWGRMLRAAVQKYGTWFYHSNINVFFHGISIPMVFNSFCAKFYGPTSTTTTFSVAVGFAKSGIILELQNNRRSVRFFDCSLLSNYSSEAEKLFIGGSEDLITFRSIRYLALSHNYQHFICAISILQQMFRESQIGCSYSPTKRHVYILQALINNQLQMNVNSERKIVIPEYVQQLFNQYCDNKKKISIHVQQLNISKDVLNYYYYAKLSSLSIFETWNKVKIEENVNWKYRNPYGMDYTNVVSLVRVDLLTRLYPNLKEICVICLPWREEMMDHLLDVLSDTQMKNHPLSKIEFEELHFYESQATIKSFEHFANEYSTRVAKMGWKIRRIERSHFEVTNIEEK